MAMKRVSSVAEVGTQPTVVLKVGTSSLLQDGEPRVEMLAALVRETVTLRRSGHNVVVVTSGAVGFGCQRLGREKGPQVVEKQALAAVGQMRLMRTWDDLFSMLGQHCGQVLLTAADLSSSSKYANARNTVCQMLEWGVVPVVNENDTVAVQELKFGDNDTLSAQVAALIGAEWLFLLTDVDGLYDKNPNADPTAKLISVVDDINALCVDTSSGTGSKLGTGGMATKLQAARIASAAGCKTVILNSLKMSQMHAVLDGEEVGTLFMPHAKPVRERKRWIIALPPRGRLVIDPGAAAAVQDRKSLFLQGIKSVEGEFMVDDAVRLMDTDGAEIGRALVNYGAAEMSRALADGAGEVSADGPDEMCHRGNICLFGSGEDAGSVASAD
mmetsp:Transcript_20574/g.66746  ORF Transcript_20574/g.66746 Transcript_20574/m.66746 type:complete len:385 (-) Transcript_20574:85-1239(-)